MTYIVWRKKVEQVLLCQIFNSISSLVLAFRVIIPSLDIGSRGLSFASPRVFKISSRKIQKSSYVNTLCAELKNKHFLAALHLVGTLTNPSREISLMGEADSRVACQETCGTGRFRRTRYWILSWASSIQSTLSQLAPLRLGLMSSVHAHNSQAAYFLSFLTKMLYKFITPMHVTCPLFHVL
jgi:hypothetical protein